MVCYKFNCPHRENGCEKDCKMHEANNKKFNKVMSEERNGKPIKNSWEDLEERAGDIK